MNTVVGVLLVLAGGLSVGSGSWTLKALRQCKFEHWMLLANFTGLVVLPWGITLLAFPGALGAMHQIPIRSLLLANLFSVGWGVANVLCAICFVRIGVALTGGILGGLGLSLGVVIPMLFKGSGLFADAPGLFTLSGGLVMGAVAMLLVGVGMVTAAGFARQAGGSRTDPRLRQGILLAVLSGILSAFPNFAFAYGQGPIIAAITGGREGIWNVFPVWSFGMVGGAIVNLVYASALVTRNRSWGELGASMKQLYLPVMCGLQFALGFALLAGGSLTLGVLGASVGWGVYQVGQNLGGQAVGVLSGEWSGAAPRAVRLMGAAVAIMVLASGLLAGVNALQGKAEGKRLETASREGLVR